MGRRRRRERPASKVNEAHLPALIASALDFTRGAAAPNRAKASQLVTEVLLVWLAIAGKRSIPTNYAWTMRE